MTAPDRDHIARLTALVEWQRDELDRLHAQAAARAVTERATGILMERLGCPADGARQQLERLAAEAGVSPAEIAADVAGETLADAPAAVRRGASRADAAAAAAPDAARLAEALLAEALSAEGVAAVAVWLLAPDGGIELAGEAGFGPREAARWRRIPPGVPSLPLLAVRQDTEIWWPSGQPPGDAAALIGRPECARAVVPLRQGGGCFGALEVCWPDALDGFTVSARRLLPALADPCAQVMAGGLPAAGYSPAWIFGLLAGLAGQVLFARALRDGDGDLAGFTIEWASEDFRDSAGRSAADLSGHQLLEVYPEAAQAGLLEAAARTLASGEPQRIGMPLSAGTLAEVSLARLFDGVVIAWRDASEAERQATLLEQAQWLGRTGGWEENLVTGQVHWAAPTFALFGLPPGHPVRLADLHQRVPAEDRAAVETFRGRLMRQADAVTAAFRIIRADDASVRQLRAFAQPVTSPAGEVIMVRGAYQDISDRYHAQVAFEATREQLADSEERAREEHDLAVRLQRAITPHVSHPVAAAGIDVTARYRPASQQHLVGGDWYDTVLLPGKNVLLAVGDVAGHGIGAVTGMVALRNHLRGLAITGAGPAQLLTWLNSAACHLAEVIATAICGIYDPQDRTLRWARAGHLPPLVIRDGAVTSPPLPGGLLLGADPDARYQEAALQLQLGDTMVLFTDGLIERRDQSLDNALAHLAQLASQPAAGIGEFADHLIDSAPSDTGDDACLVAVRIR